MPLRKESVMTNPATSSTLWRAAQLSKGRTPIATAVFVKGHEKVHAAEFLDGETVLIFQSVHRKKSVVRRGEVIERGESSFTDCQLFNGRLDSIGESLSKDGFETKVRKCNPVNLPLLHEEHVSLAA
jgi:hypothetical protein